MWVAALSAGAAVRFRRHRLEQTLLYRLIEQYYPEFEMQWASEHSYLALAAFNFAEYGGPPVRPLQAITALAISLLPFIGMAMWFLRRRRRREATNS